MLESMHENWVNGNLKDAIKPILDEHKDGNFGKAERLASELFDALSKRDQKVLFSMLFDRIEKFESR